MSVFLREEVCAVSDHLAAVSLFDSDEWMSCLQKFNGWTDSEEKAEAKTRELVSKQKLRSLTEPGDVDSPLLRSQIDEQFLRAMASARSQMVGTGVQTDRRKGKEVARSLEVSGEDEVSKPSTLETTPSQSNTVSLHQTFFLKKYMEPSVMQFKSLLF